MENLNNIKIKAKDLNHTDKQIVQAFYALIEKFRLKNPTTSKAEAIEYCVIMTAKIYGRSLIDELNKLNKQQSNTKTS